VSAGNVQNFGDNKTLNKAEHAGISPSLDLAEEFLLFAAKKIALIDL
jgi:hypothetical protein